MIGIAKYSTLKKYVVDRSGAEDFSKKMIDPFPLNIKFLESIIYGSDPNASEQNHLKKRDNFLLRLCHIFTAQVLILKFK